MLSLFWLSSIVCAEVLVICLAMWLAFRHAPSLTFSLDLVEVEALPSHRVLLSRWSSVHYGLLRLLTRLPPGFHLFGLYHSLRWLWATDRMRSLLFHRLLSQHPVLHTPKGSLRLQFQVLRRFHGLRCATSNSAPSCPVSGSRSRRCKIHFMLRAVALLPFRRGLQRFCTTSRPAAQVACYVAS
jgi:hypothetical protein